ncbi:MAG TPA: DedA family protein [Candidatus Binatia bacterium]
MDSARATPYPGAVHHLAHHLASVEPLLAEYGYAAVFLAIFVEGFGIPAPGQTLLIAGALLAARGELSVTALLVVAVLASAAGNLVGFWLGRVGGRRILDKIGAGPRLERMEKLFQRRGGVLVAFGRFVDGTRQLAGIVAGSLDMPSGTFFAWNVLGAVAWAVTWSLGPVLLEEHLGQLAAVMHAYRRLFLLAGLVAVVLGVLWLRRGSTAHTT